MLHKVENCVIAGFRDRKECQGCVVVFDDMLHSNQESTSPCLTRGRLENLDVYYLGQPYVDLPKKYRE